MASSTKSVDVGGYYCTECGACYRRIPGEGVVTCRRCGHLGLRCFDRPPKRVTCPDHPDWKGWDDGGVNDDLGQHVRREHPKPAWWNDRVGTYRGRKWHITGALETRPPGNRWHPRTLCGLWGEPDWRPSWRNTVPATCGDCLTIYEAETGVSNTSNTDGGAEPEVTE